MAVMDKLRWALPGLGAEGKGDSGLFVTHHRADTECRKERSGVSAGSLGREQGGQGAGGLQRQWFLRG